MRPVQPLTEQCFLSCPSWELLYCRILHCICIVLQSNLGPSGVDHDWSINDSYRRLMIGLRAWMHQRSRGRFLPTVRVIAYRTCPRSQSIRQWHASRKSTEAVQCPFSSPWSMRGLFEWCAGDVTWWVWHPVQLDTSCTSVVRLAFLVLQYLGNYCNQMIDLFAPRTTE